MGVIVGGVASEIFESLSGKPEAFRYVLRPSRGLAAGVGVGAEVTRRVTGVGAGVGVW